MKNVHLLAVAFAMIACTHSHSKVSVKINDSTTCTKLSNNTAVAPVVKSKPAVLNDAPELPYFKDVIDFKRMFW